MNVESLKIVTYPHPALRHAGKPLPAIDRHVHLVAGRMLELMYDRNGLGLAAPQVALPYQMTVVNWSGDPNQKEHEAVLINPVILEKKGSIESDEGCLSFPELFQKVRRAKTVKVVYYNLKGEQVEVVTTTDLQSRLFQHEIDHLHGILYIDKMGTLARIAARGALREFEAEHRKAQERGEIPPDAEIEKTLRELELRMTNPPPVM